MNRIILIGNGFDLAHGLPTKYTDFVNSYWADFKKALQYKDTGEPWYSDDFITINYRVNGNFSRSGMEFDQHILSLIREKFPRISDSDIQIGYKNRFFAAINNKLSEQNWVDIENEYYRFLKSYLKQIDPTERNKSVKKLNEEFCQVKNMLEKYLTGVCERELSCIELNEYIMNEMFLGKGIESRCVALLKQEAYGDSRPTQKQKMSEVIHNIIQYEEEHGEQRRLQAMITRTPYQNNPLYSMNEAERERFVEQTIDQFGVVPDHTLVLNFNYTSTFEALYTPELPLIQIINIHGELNNPANPIIFGYGDELDGDYKAIESTNDNDFLDNIKSIQYHNTGNYRKLLSFLEGEPYQVFIMGHSCGNSDRTLLNTIFEHENCISIKPFFYQWRDEQSGEIKDNYTELTKNISRNFNDKQKMRDVVVNREFCLPLVPCEKA